MDVASPMLDFIPRWEELWIISFFSEKNISNSTADNFLMPLLPFMDSADALADVLFYFILFIKFMQLVSLNATWTIISGSPNYANFTY